MVSFQGFSQNLLINGGFESGGAGVGFQTDYTLPAAAGTSTSGNYSLTTDSFTMNNANFAHAGDYPTGTGRMMVVDGSGSTNRVWYLVNGSTIGVVSGRTYEFTYYIRSISGTNSVSNSAIIDVTTNGTTTIPQLMSGPSIAPIGNPSAWTKVVYRWTATTNNAQIILIDSQTFGGGVGNDFAIDNLSLVDVASICQTPAVSVIQPTCAVPTGTATFTSPLNTNPAPLVPTDLFISEVTDESTGALSYIEIYNGTGTSKNLTNYKLKVYNNGNPGPSLNCDIPLLGILANNDVFVVSVGSNTNQGGVIPDMVVNLCPGFNTNDNVRLTTSADVLVDLWGRTDGVDFTPGNMDGYTYRRLPNVPHPSTVWNPADWTALDPQDYTDIGNYLMTIYEYSLNSTAYQSSPTFSGLPPNTTYNNATIRDVISGCVSIPVSITINPIAPIAAPGVTPVTYCQNAAAVPLTATPGTGGTLNWYGTNATGGTASATAPTPSTTGAVGSVVHYYVSQTIGGCESPRADIAVTISNNTPTAAPFLFCDGPNTTPTSVAFDFNNVGQTSFSYSYSIAGGPPVTGSLVAPSHFDVPVPAPGTEVTFTITWNGVCTPSQTRTCYATCTVTPVLAITNPAAVCAPNTVDITQPAVTAGSTGGGTLSYWNDAAATSPLTNPTAIAISGTYYIKSALGNCDDIEPVVVTINPTPSLVITSPAAVCAPNTVNITAAAVTAGSTGGGTLSYWTNPGATTPLANPAAVAINGTYYIKSTAGTCSDIEPVSVTINTTPVLTITNPVAVCSPATVDITLPAVTAGSTGAGTLTYWTNPAGTIALANPTAIAVSGTYYIKSTLGSCTDIEPVVVTITTTPVLTITNPAAVCSPNTVNITLPAITAGSTGGGTLSYWTNAGATSALATPTAATNGTYYIKSTVGTCSDIEPVTVTVNPTPSLLITNPAAVCSPNTVNITLPAVTAGSTGTGTLSYWTDSAATVTLVNPNAIAVSGTYYIKSTLGSCSDTEPVTVTIGTTPSLTITDPAAVCAPNTVDITLPAVTSGSMGGGTLSYWTNPGATTPLVNPTAIAANGTYYIKSTVGACSDIEPVIVTVNPSPVLTITNPAAVCSPNTVDITLPAITAGSTGGGTLSYWTNAGATTALANPSAVSTGGTYYIKSTLGSCSDIEPVIVTINPTPSLTITNPAAVCAPNTVDITSSLVTAGSTGGGTLSYWTNAGATIALANPSAVSTGGTYYIKSTLGSCSDIEPVIVTINPTPSLTITNPAAVCAPNTVDITLPAVTAGSTAGTLTYWINPGATSALANPTAIAVSGTYYIKSTLGSCFDIEPVIVTISNPNLVITNPAAVCAPDTVDITLPAVTAGSTGGGVLSYWTDAAATIALANPTAVAIGGTYYIKSTVGTCSDTEPVVVSINANFAVNNPQPLQMCDPNNDGFETFDLTQVINTITGGNPNYTVSFHETQVDASIGGTSIPTPSAYDTILPDSQTIYIRVTSTTSTCFQIIPLQLIVNPTPEATEPADYELCDYTGAVGQEPFDLTTRIAEILGGISPATHTVSFYTSLSDAQAPTGAITNLTAYPAGPFQTLYVRVETTATGCFDIVELNLVVNPLPNSTQPNYPQYSLCDYTGAVGYEAFDLQGRVDAILLGQSGMDVTFHISLGDAQNNTGIITNLLYTNQVQYVQTLGIRITNRDTGCYVVSTMDIRVEPLPTLIPPTAPYRLCDGNQDGFTTFDLTTLLPGLTGGITTYTVSFHETLTDAQANGTTIPDPSQYTNINPYVQVLYVRAEDNLTHCVSIMTIELNIDPSPIAPVALSNIIECDDDTAPQSGSTLVDLTQQSAAVLAQQPAGSYTVSYYNNQAAAQSASGAGEIIPDTAYFGTDGQTIWVRVENNTTHCYNVGSFQLEINTPLALTTPAPLSMCDDDASPNDQYHVFDLSVKDNEINQGTGFAVTYYPSLALAQAGAAGTQIATPTAYQNTSPAVQTLGVVVTTADGCKSVTTLDIRVLPVPTPNTNPPALAPKCDDNNPGDMLEYFDLTANAAYIINGDPNLTLHYYASQADALVPQNEIPVPSNALVGANVWIRVENNRVDYQGNHCYVLVEQALSVNPLPQVVQPLAPLRVCDDNADGIAQFDLNDPALAPLILGTATTGQQPSDYTISYYLSPAGANPFTNTGEAPLASPYTNTTADTQDIYIRVVNNATGCVNATGVLTLAVEEYAQATGPQAFSECDNYNDPYDGVHRIDLTQYESAILNGQNPAVFIVSYYTSLADAIAGTNALSPAQAQAYETDPDTDTIWVKVENSSNSITPFCYAITTIEINVERYPNPVINTPGGVSTICVDFITDAVIRPLTLDAGMANPGNYTYEWFEAADPTTVIGTGPTYTVNTPSVGGATRSYTVNVTSNTPLACATTSGVFDVLQSGPAVIPAGTTGYTVSDAFSDSQVITVNIQGYGTYEYSLDDGPRQASNVFENVPLGTHVIHVWDTEGGIAYSCEELVITQVSVIDYPHYFTPNGDGIHDTWNIVGLGGQPNAKIYIFDRYGKLMKQISSTGEGWDGTYNGHALPSDDYWFSVDFTENATAKQFKAHFSLKR
jgi:gliding motility-associated-like protein